MKARSVVFTHLQWPATVFGLPPLLFGMVSAVAAIGYALPAIFGVPALSIFVFVILETLGVWIAWKAKKKDKHVETVFTTCAAFWKGPAPTRWRLAGTPPTRNEKGGARP